MKVDLLLDIASTRGDTDKPVRLPALEKLVARGDPMACDAESLPACLLDLFRVPAHGAPIAALTLLGDGIEPGEDYWLRADPVYLHATRTRLMCTPLPEGDLSDDEARGLVAALKPPIAATGHELIMAHPQRWYIRCIPAPCLHTEPPLAESGLLTEDQMPSGPDGPCWRRLMTEAQMLLHTHEVNSSREATGKMLANGIWPWGGGRLGSVAASTYTHVFSEDPLALGLARAAKSAALQLPQDIGQAIASLAPASHLLLVVSAGPSEGDPAHIDAERVMPLLASLEQGDLVELRIMLVDRKRPLGRIVRRAHLRRFWRRPRPLLRHA